jgi:hypothetical protein
MLRVSQVGFAAIVCIVVSSHCVVVSSQAFAQCDDVYPRAGENLKAFEARMDACFAPEIARRGIKALIQDESSAYNKYIRLRNYWEPRLLPSGSFEEYFRKERTYYTEYGRSRATARPGVDNALLPSASSLTSPWWELGPYTKPPTTVGAEGTGPISFLTFYPPSPSHMLCGSMAGGLWYSKNGGAFWMKTGTDTEIARSGVGTAVFHPTDYRTWFAASSGNNDEGPGFIGYTGGIFRTRDEGVTWTRIADETSLNGIWTRIFKIAIHPINANRLYAATSSGLFTTNNALAQTPLWTPVAALAGEYIYDFNFKPGSPNTLYAAVATWSGPNLINWRLLYSTNLTPWQDIPGQAAYTAGAARVVIEVSPAKTDNLYALVIPPGGAGSRLLFFDFVNSQWHVITSAAQITTGGRHPIGVDRVDPNVVYLSHWIDGRRYTYLPTPAFIDFYSSWHTGGTYHPDIECLVPHPFTTNEVWMCHHGGISVSLNKGVSWSDRTTGVGSAQVYRMADAASDPAYLAVGLYHDGTDVTASGYSPLWAPNWRQFPQSFCDGMRPLIDPINPSYMWHSCQWGGWWMSSDTGATFNGNGPASPFWVVEAAFNRLNPATQFRLAIGTGGYETVVRTTDRFATWTQIADFHTIYNGPYILWKVYTSETDGNHLLVHLIDMPTNVMKLYRTRTANAPAANVIWEDLPLPDNRWISDVDFDPVNPNIVYLTNSSSSSFSNVPIGSHMVFKMDYTNPGLHTSNVCTPGICEDLTQNLPNGYTGQDTLAVEQNSNGGIYLGTDFGVYYSDNASRAPAGGGWTQLGTALPNVGSSGMSINMHSRTVRVGTNGRGAWEHELVSTASTTCTAPPPQMTAWWPLDGGTGALMHDLLAAFGTGVDNVGTAINGPTVVPAKVDGGLHFNGTSQYVAASSQAELNLGTADFSIDAWIRTSAQGVQTIVDKRSTIPIGYALFLYNGRLGLQIGDRSGSGLCSSNNTVSACTNWIAPGNWPNAADGQWHHVAASVGRNSATGGRLYVDGWLVLTFNPTIRNQSLDNTAVLWIAASHASSSGVQTFFPGDIDEVEIFKRAISAAEVQAIFNAGRLGKCKCGGNPSTC